MTDNRKPLQPSPPDKHRPRAGQDFVIRKQAAQFPTVGMTLSSYSQQPASKATRRSSSTPVTTKLDFSVKRPGRLKRVLKGITLKRSVIILAVLVLLIGGWLGGKFAYNAHKVFGGNILGVLTSTKLKGESSGRVNILLAGNSADDVGHQGGDLTDSIMIISVDTKNHKAFLLSVPRDLWVSVDGSHQKINAAYVDGKANRFSQQGYPNGGMGQLEQVIEANFGISINYYALVNYTALRDAVNAVGGVDVSIQSSDPRGLYDPSKDYTTKGPLVKLTNGTHHLNGQQALDLARARGDDYRSYGFAQADFTRTADQRLLLVALKSKAVSAGVITNPTKLSSLSDAIGNNVTTDFTLGEVHRLYDLVKNITGNNIQSLSLNTANGKNLLANYTAPDGESTLIPAAGVDNFDDIQAFIAQQSSTDPIIQESAPIVVLNATDSAGLAAKVRFALTGKHLNIAAVGDANAAQATTTIIDLSGGKFPATHAFLQKLYGNNFTATNPYAGMYTANFIILAGNDQLKTSATSN